MVGKDFRVMNFPHVPRVGYVYVLFWVADFLSEEIPFYVGETDKIPRRMDNYDEAQFTSARDFIVGEAIRYFEREKNLRIVVKYRSSSDEKNERRREESEIIRGLWSKGVRLLNPEAGGLHRYDQKSMPKKKIDKADYDRIVQEQRKRVRDFCDTSAVGTGRTA